MLRSLRIQHFALIEEVQLDFEQGFTVFTGETGSGKSIILAAAQLILRQQLSRLFLILLLSIFLSLKPTI